MNLNETKTFLEFISSAGDIRELRAFMPGGEIWAGVFNDPAVMARNARGLAMKHNADALYYTLNPVKSEVAGTLAARQLNKVAIKPYNTTRDGHIRHRAIYALDFDPERESGICSTREEKAAALEVAERVRAFLTNHGWPEPIVADSGNGYHLLYRGDYCGAASAAWRYLLKALAKRFNTDEVKVDTSVYNPSRILRLPGSWNRKGADTVERPHRRSYVVSYPEKWEPVMHGPCISRLATSLGYVSEYDRSTPTRGKQRELLIDDQGVLKLIDDQGVLKLIDEFHDQLQLHRVSRDGDITYFALASCPFKGAPHRDQLVGHGKTTIMLRPHSIGFSCFSSDCVDHTFNNLLRHLHAETGRRPSMPIWAAPEITDAHINAWGGLNVTNIVDGVEVTEFYHPDEELSQAYSRMREAEFLASPLGKYDSKTYAVVLHPQFDEKAPPVWPLEPWGVTCDQLRDAYIADRRQAFYNLDAGPAEIETFVAEVRRVIYDDHDYKLMAETLGKAEMYHLHRSIERQRLFGEELGPSPTDNPFSPPRREPHRASSPFQSGRGPSSEKYEFSTGT